MLHTNSMLSSREVEKFNRHKIILDVYRTSSRPLTDREVMARCGFTDMNSCRPRISELIEGKHLIERGSTKCPITGKTVRLVGIPYHYAQQEMEF